MSKVSTIKLTNEFLKFSCAHFTVFSATEKERLHGHNFQLHAEITAAYTENGLAFDYRHYKKKLYKLCDELDEHVLMATKSEHLRLEEAGDQLHVHFNGQLIPFLKDDVKLLPITNITVEELAQWFIDRLLEDQDEIEQHCVQAFKITIFTTPSQSGSVEWRK